MDPHFDGVIFQTHVAELHRRTGRSFPGVAVIDVRPSSAFAAGHIAGAISAPEAAGGISGQVAGAPDVVIVGEEPEDPRVRRATLDLRQAGVGRITELAGGMHAWREAGLPVEAGTA